ncbi:MAG: hypothetical protein AB1916_12520 [Thermodesulfobacteriota bacterium]
MRSILLALLASLVLGAAVSVAVADFPSAPLRLVYRETKAGKSCLREYLVRQDGERISLVATEPGITRTVEALPDFSTLHEGYEDQSGNRLTLVRQGRRMVLSGTLDSRAVSREFEVDDTAWYGSILFVRDFVLAGTPETVFYMTQPEDNQVIKLKAIREAEESIQVDGETVETVRVRFTLPDFRSIFWSSTYWFRASDGLFVKSLETRGPPGAAKVSVELVDEGRA